MWHAFTMVSYHIPYDFHLKKINTTEALKEEIKLQNMHDADDAP